MEYDQSFIQPEWRSEYFVSETMKKVWWIQITILQDFGKWCDEHGLRWFVYGGALIGAVRHKGFIHDRQPHEPDGEEVQQRNCHRRDAV